MRIQSFIEIEMHNLAEQIKGCIESQEILKKEMMNGILDDSFDVGQQKSIMGFADDNIDIMENELNELRELDVPPFEEFPTITMKDFVFRDYDSPIRFKIKVGNLCFFEGVGTILNHNKVSINSLSVFKPTLEWAKKAGWFKLIMDKYIRSFVRKSTFYGSPNEAAEKLRELYPQTACESFGTHFIFRKNKHCRFAVVNNKEVLFYD